MPDMLQPVHPWFRHFDLSRDGDPLDFVVSKNLKRRHLDKSQRSMLLADIEPYRHGGDRRSADQAAKLHLDRKRLAKTAQVSERSVAYAAKIYDRAALR